MQIGKRKIGRQYPCFIVAEIGTTHLGDKSKAFQLIDAARDAGANCVKFQCIYADEILHPLTGAIDLPGGKIDLYERFRALEKPPEFYMRIKEYTEKKGLIFLCTPFGPASIALLKQMEVDAIKIASPELNHLPLLREAAVYGKPVILSTGVSLLSDIELALSIVKDQAVLLHCITAYPAPEKEYNLSILPHLEGIFGVPVGVSDHSLDHILVPVLSRIKGACIIEKHFTLSHSGKGLDDPIALEPPDFRSMVERIRTTEEAKLENELSWLMERYGEETVNEILGHGIKRLAPSEKNNYGTTRRSVHTLHDIQEGEVFSPGNTGIFRSEKNLKPGFEPRLLPVIIGKRAKRKIPAGQGITWDDIF
ncbi:MAG: N-acetylneuraminate synthase family protein [Spirochaetales bacterium]|nr:N-acetylneuraminate synthase family protein [Spirochaetales bacterium]